MRRLREGPAVWKQRFTREQQDPPSVQSELAAGTCKAPIGQQWPHEGVHALYQVG
jgi:hypothetical protein